MALRTFGQFAVALPNKDAAIRKLTITVGAGTAATGQVNRGRLFRRSDGAGQEQRGHQSDDSGCC